MKELKKKEIKETKTIVDKIICDFCGQEIKNRCGNFVDITAQTGETYDEYDNDTIHHVIDCCVDCFLNKVKYVIEEVFKVKFREVDDDDYFENKENYRFKSDYI